MSDRSADGCTENNRNQTCGNDGLGVNHVDEMKIGEIKQEMTRSAAPPKKKEKGVEM